MSVPNAAWPSLTTPSTKSIAAIRSCAVRAHVVADDEGAVGPADEHRPVEGELVDDRRHVVGPEPAVGVVLGLERRLGHAVAAQVERDEPELVGQALSYCGAQQRWFCDQPWMKRIGGPAGLPHSRTCSRRPPPPVTV